MDLLPSDHKFPFDIHNKLYKDVFYDEIEYNRYTSYINGTLKAYEKHHHFPNIYTDYRDDWGYEITSHGFRCNSEYDKIDLMVFGCSHTFGVGAPKEDTWGYKLSKQLSVPEENYCNLGKAGFGIYQVLMVAQTAVLRHKPGMVFVLWPDPSRGIISDKHGQIRLLSTNSIQQPNIMETFGDDGDTKSEAWVNWIYKNLSYEKATMRFASHMLQQLCDQVGCLLVEDTVRQYTPLLNDPDHLARGRDLLHFEGLVHSRIATQFYDLLVKKQSNL